MQRAETTRHGRTSDAVSGGGTDTRPGDDDEAARAGAHVAPARTSTTIARAPTV